MYYYSPCPRLITEEQDLKKLFLHTPLFLPMSTNASQPMPDIPEATAKASAPRPSLVNSRGEDVKEAMRQHREMVVQGKFASQASTKAVEHDKRIRNEFLQRAKFIKGQVEGAQSLIQVSGRAVEIRETTDLFMLRAAEHYGALVDLQRYGYILGNMLGQPIEQHLVAPTEASAETLTDIALMTRAVKETRRLIKNVLDTLAITRNAQKTAASKLDILSEALNSTYISEEDLRAVAEEETATDKDALIGQYLSAADSD